MAARYLELLARDRPRLTREEWIAVFQALWGTYFTPDRVRTIPLLWMSVADAGVEIEVEVDRPALIDKLKPLAYGKCLAVVEALETYDALSEQPDEAERFLRHLVETPQEQFRRAETD